MNATGTSAVRMANQIALNFETNGQDNAIVATADHIAQFWDPRMKVAAFELLDSGQADFSETAAAALAILKSGTNPASQTRATQFSQAKEAGHSDAG